MQQRITKYIGIYKIAPFLGCYFIASSGLYIFDSLFVSVIIALLVGVGVEAFDAKTDGNRFDPMEVGCFFKG